MGCHRFPFSRCRPSEAPNICRRALSPPSEPLVGRLSCPTPPKRGLDDCQGRQCADRSLRGLTPRHASFQAGSRPSLPAPYDPRLFGGTSPAGAALAFATGAVAGFAAVPTRVLSTRRRMASGRVGRSSCARRQLSRWRSESFNMRTVTGADATGGLPLFDFLPSSIDAMTL
jgi:hypothetical protein